RFSPFHVSFHAITATGRQPLLCLQCSPPPLYQPTPAPRRTNSELHLSARNRLKVDTKKAFVGNPPQKLGLNVPPLHQLSDVGYSLGWELKAKANRVYQRRRTLKK